MSSPWTSRGQACSKLREREAEDKVCDAGCRIRKPALFQARGNPRVVVVAGPAVEPHSCSQSGPGLTLKVRAYAAINVNGQYKMQDTNHWYSLQRSNTGQRPYSIQNSTSNTPSLTAGLHDNQALSSVYSFASAVRPTQGETFSPSPDTNLSPHIYHSVPSPFPSIHGRTFASSCTNPIFQHEWLSLSFT